jgi:hypothetical protein
MKMRRILLKRQRCLLKKPTLRNAEKYIEERVIIFGLVFFIWNASFIMELFSYSFT